MHGRPVHQDLGEPSPSHPNRWRILGVLVLALLVTSIDHTIINVALPQMVVDLDASAAQLQWIVAAYTVVFAGLLLTAGSLGDRFGRRHALAAGLATFMTGSILSALAGSTTMLIAGRGVMGVGGALIMPTTLSILVNSFGDPGERARAIAIWTAASGAGIALGPIVGGMLMRSFAWGSVFWINVPLLAAAFVGTLHIVPDSRDPNATRPDPVGALLSIASIGTLVYAIIDAPRTGWTSTSTLVMFTGAAVTGAVFVVWELRRHEPMLDMRLFTNRSFSAGSVALAMLFFAMAGTVFLQAQYLQFVLGYTPLAAGAALVPAAFGMIVGSGAGAHLAGHLGGRIAVVTGTVLGRGRRCRTGRVHRRHVLHADRRRTPAVRSRRRHRHACRHRTDHGHASARPGRRRLGSQRHGPRAGRRPRRRRHRQRRRQYVCLEPAGAARRHRRHPGQLRGLLSPTTSAPRSRSAIISAPTEPSGRRRRTRCVRQLDDRFAVGRRRTRRSRISHRLRPPPEARTGPRRTRPSAPGPRTRGPQQSDRRAPPTRPCPSWQASHEHHNHPHGGHDHVAPQRLAPR